MWGLQFLVMLAMIGLNGVFAGYEIALATMSSARLQRLADSRRRGARAALHLKKNLEGSLAVVQLGITLVGAIAGATAGVGAQEELTPLVASTLKISPLAAELFAVGVVVLPLTAFMIIFGELIPKIFAIRNAELVLLSLSPVMYWFSIAVWPLVWVLEQSVQVMLFWVEKARKLARPEDKTAEPREMQELRASVSIARTSRLIGSQEERIMLGAANLSQRPVREIMLPTEFISTLNLESSAGDALIAAHMDMHTRFPVTERKGDPQSIVGYVMFKDIVAHMRFSPKENSIRNIVRTIDRFPDSMTIAQALERLIHEHSHIALVVDSDQRIVGMVTMEDLIEELVGEIEDEYDRLPSQIVQTGRGWIVGGGVTIETLKKQTGIHLPIENQTLEIRTINDWIASRVNGPIVGSESIQTDDVKVLVRKTRRHKVMEAYFSPKE